jgi:hypothetical protein
MAWMAIVKAATMNIAVYSTNFSGMGEEKRAACDDPVPSTHRCLFPTAQ